MRWLIVVMWSLVLAGCGASANSEYTYEVTDAHGNVYSDMVLVNNWGNDSTEFKDSTGRSHLFKGSHHYVRFTKQKAD